MKKILICILFCLSSLITAYTNNTIPEIVKTMFTQLYPQIEAPFWEDRSDGIVATFMDAEGLKKVFFNEDGRWIETRIYINRAQLPEGVQQFVKENYQAADITFCGKVHSDSGQWYRIESELPDRVVLKTLDESGSLIEEETIFLSTLIETAPAVTAIKLLPAKQIQPIKKQ